MNKNIPLIDLHCHLDGSITLEIAKKLAALQNIEIPDNDEELLKLLTVDENCASLTDFLKCFDLPIKLLQTPEGICEAVYLVQEKLKKQGIVYLEIRFAPSIFTQKNLSQLDAVNAALEGLKRSDLHTNFILCCMRGDGKEIHEKNLETIRLASKFLTKDGGVVAVDLAGAEALFDTKNFKEEFKLAVELNLPFTIHAGEAAGAASVDCALDFGAKRIGHGVRAFEDEAVLKRIIDSKIPLEMCPSSNKQTHALSDMKDYPLKKYLALGVKATVNTDDMAICGTTLREEFKYLEQNFNLSAQEEKTLLLNSADAAFTDEKTKAWLRQMIENADFS